MNIFDDPTLRNAQKDKAYLSGRVLKTTDSGIVEFNFKYAIIKSRSYEITNATLPGFEFVSPKENIKTLNVDIPFVTGDKVRLADGRLMTVRNVERVDDPNRALMDLPTLTAWILQLEGGSPK